MSEPIVLAIVLAVVTVVVTGVARAVCKFFASLLTRMAEHLAQLARLPDSLDRLEAAVSEWRSDHEERITALENGVSA